jgi:hypothetical protein
VADVEVVLVWAIDTDRQGAVGQHYKGVVAVRVVHGEQIVGLVLRGAESVGLGIEVEVDIADIVV